MGNVKRQLPFEWWVKSFSLLPAGKVPNMIVVNTNDSHYDLVVPRQSRLAQSFLMENLKEESLPSSICLSKLGSGVLLTTYAVFLSSLQL